MNFSEVMLSQGITSLIINYLFIAYHSESVEVENQETRKYLLIRNVLHSIFRGLIIVVSFYLPSPIIHTISASSSISSSIIESFLYNIILSTKIKFAMVFSLIGVFFQANNQYLQHLWDPTYSFSS